MAARKASVPKRTRARQVPTVEFELDGWDAPFSLPDVNKLTQKQQWAMKSGDISRLRTEVLGDYADIIEDMDDSEVEEFMKGWMEASGVTEGESDAV